MFRPRPSCPFPRCIRSPDSFGSSSVSRSTVSEQQRIWFILVVLFGVRLACDRNEQKRKNNIHQHDENTLCGKITRYYNSLSVVCVHLEFQLEFFLTLLQVYNDHFERLHFYQDIFRISYRQKKKKKN